MPHTLTNDRDVGREAGERGRLPEFRWLRSEARRTTGPRARRVSRHAADILPAEPMIPPRAPARLYPAAAASGLTAEPPPRLLAAPPPGSARIDSEPRTAAARSTGWCPSAANGPRRYW